VAHCGCSLQTLNACSGDQLYSYYRLLAHIPVCCNGIEKNQLDAPPALCAVVGTCSPPASALAQTAPIPRLLCLWQLWKHRNEVMFNGLQPSLSLLQKDCREDAILWRARPSRRNSFWCRPLGHLSPDLISKLTSFALGVSLPLRPCTMGVLREGAYQNKPSVLLSTDAYLYRRGA
jgi:hypothetical protein